MANAVPALNGSASELTWRPDRKFNSDHATSLPRAISQFERTSMRLRDLPRQHQADSAALGLGRVERNKSVAWVHQARTVVFDRDDHMTHASHPPYVNLRPAFARGGFARQRLLAIGARL